MSTENYTWLSVPGANTGREKLLKPLDAKSVKIDNRRFCIGRVGDTYYAVDDRCPHAGAALGGGWCTNETEVVCPLHHIRFSLKTGKNTSGEGYKVKHYPLKWEGDQLYIGLPRKKWYQFWK